MRLALKEHHSSSLSGRERMTDMVITRIIALLIGYVFGLFLSGYLFGKAQDVDIRS